MPAFTYVASLIVAEVVGIAGAAVLGSAGVAFVTSAIALGLALTTARVLGLTGGSGGTTQDPGVRIQLPPATYNKVPVVYGHANQKGMITDARISNSNKTMTYVIALSEVTQTGTFTVGDMYWNDKPLAFLSAAGSEHIVAATIEDATPPGTFNYNLAELVRIRVYSGGVEAADQIFPEQSTGNITTATTILDQGDVKCPAGYALNDLVFAVVQLDYNSEKGVTGLPQLTFELTNSLKNPGQVWYDYMTSTRYGAGVPSSQIDLTSLGDWEDLCDTIPPNQFLAGGTTSTNQVRYECNGIISTGDTVKNNIDKISIAGEAWTSFDYSLGQWKVVQNRAATEIELTNAFHFNDDNILGEVGISTTNLEDLYNYLEVEFASRKIRDQNDYFKAEIDPTLRNDLEPDNKLSMRLEMANNALHAARIGLIELKQSRKDLIITFRSDYTALQVQAGDVVKVTNSVYGFNSKLFRVSKIREVEDEVGGISVEVTALEYDADVYIDETLEDSADTPGSGIPTFGGSASLAAPSVPIVATISTTTPSFSIQTTIDANSGPVDEVQWWYSTSTSTGFAYLTNEYPISGNFGAGTTVSDTITIPVAGTFYFKARTGLGSRYSTLSTSTSVGFVWNPNDYGGI